MTSPVSSSSPSIVNHYVRKTTTLLVRVTPRLAVAYYVSLYGIGYCYRETDIFTVIRRKAIEILFPYVGYAGLGALIPRIDWYSAAAVQLIFFFFGGIMYDISERVAIRSYKYFFSHQPPSTTIQIQKLPSPTFNEV